jgi:hypothetical protein
LSRDFVYKRTDQLSKEDTEQFLALFARVFPRVMSHKEFERKYLRTPLGYSHHGLMYADGSLAGAYNLVPYVYNYFGAQRLFGLSVDTMVAQEHRGGPFNMVKMATPACDEAQQDGVSFAFGFPNENAHGFTTRVLKWSDMGELDFYALPINVGALRPALRWANRVSRLSAGGFVRLPRLGRRIEREFRIEKVHDRQFEEHRYGREHQVIHLGHGGQCVYRTCLEADQVRTTYIIDVVPLTPACFARAVRAVYGLVGGQTDLLLYVGRLPFRPSGMMRVPPSRRPRRIWMCGRILDRGLMDDRVFKVDNWNVNISNFDVR